jgi:carbamoyltransferase
MLLVHRLREDKADLMGATNHMGTGRLQTIRREANPRYYDLVEKFGEATGVPVLLNTSFNLRGEPIVTSRQTPSGRPVRAASICWFWATMS